MSSSFWFILLLLIAMANIALSTVPTFQDSHDSAVLEVEDERVTRYGRYLAQKTCNIYPRVCKAKGSAGPDCCYKQCVDVKTDTRNCGKCGSKCRYGEICCQGHCVNPSFNKKHCGQCNHKCNRETSCVYGLCSYA